ncbi:long-chain-fatty-acid--CoA ligase [Nocardia jiangsuensis]|uniref:Long-chain-fatty-acid--CoA ligase n=1 Tax=Nocardia jiangsuensis TaxID=1691563 RepID=A0ABV8E018_9NOCA
MSEFMSQLLGPALETGRGLWSGPSTDLTETSWTEISARAAIMAGRLQSLGVGHGSRVAMLALDPADVAPLAQAVWMRGAALTMLQQPTPQADLGEWQAGCRSVVAMLGIEHLVLGEPFLAVADGFAEHGPTIVRLDDDWGTTPGDLVDCAEEDIAVYQLTSGSTGSPKAVAISHGNLHANGIAMRGGSLGTPEVDVMVSWLPLSHDMGMIGFLVTPMAFGFKAVCVSPLEFLRSPLNWLRIITDHRGTITAAPNFAYSIIQRRLARVEQNAHYDLSTLRFALCGAEPIDPAAMRGFCAAAGRFGFSPNAVVAAYGMAEATLAVSFAGLGGGMTVEVVDSEQLAGGGRAVPVTAADDAPAGREVVLLGRPLSGMEVRVATGAQADPGPRVVGELLIRGAAVTSHYLTTEGRLDAVDGDGWLHTGDVGYLTEDGQVAICGRSKNVIIVSGRNIYPADVERVAELVDGVRRGGVVAFGTSAAGRPEELRVVVEVGGGDLDHREIQRAVARRVFDRIGVSPKVLTRPRGAIPKTPSGKIRHVEAKAVFAGVTV